DAHRQPIDRRQRSARLPACGTGVSSGASASLVEDDKRLHHRLACCNSLQTTFEIRPWRVAPVAEVWRGIVKGACLEGVRVVGIHCRCGHRLISLWAGVSSVQYARTTTRDRSRLWLTRPL